MGNQGFTSGKRQREQNRKDKARAKQERLAARRAEARDGHGPPIASFDEAHALVTAGAAPEDAMPPASPSPSPAPANRRAPGDRPAAAPPAATPRRR